MIAQTTLDVVAKQHARVRWLADTPHEANRAADYHRHQRNLSISSMSPTGIGNFDGLVNVFAKRHESESDCDKEQWIWMSIHDTQRFPNVLGYICRVGNSLISEYNDGLTLEERAKKLSISNKLTILWQLYTGAYQIWQATGWLPSYMSMTDVAVKQLPCLMRFKINGELIDSHDFCQIYNFDHWFRDYGLGTQQGLSALPHLVVEFWLVVVELLKFGVVSNVHSNNVSYSSVNEVRNVFRCLTTFMFATDMSHNRTAMSLLTSICGLQTTSGGLQSATSSSSHQTVSLQHLVPATAGSTVRASATPQTSAATSSGFNTSAVRGTAMKQQQNQLRQMLYVMRGDLRLFTPADLKHFMIDVLKVPFPYVKNDKKVHVLSSYDPLVTTSVKVVSVKRV